MNQCKRKFYPVRTSWLDYSEIHPGCRLWKSFTLTRISLTLTKKARLVLSVSSVFFVAEAERFEPSHQVNPDLTV